MRVLLTKGNYKQKYPPMALMKISTYHKRRGDEVVYYDGEPEGIPLLGDFDKAYVTTLFSWYYQKVFDTVNACKWVTDDIQIGGVMASTMPDFVEKSTGIRPFVGVWDEVDNLPLDFSFTEDKSKYYAYTSRGCVNRCGFCAVPKMEPEFIPFIPLPGEVRGDNTDLVLFDNNIFASPRFDDVVDMLKERNFKSVDFNQGLDARLTTAEKMRRLAELPINTARIAFDHWEQHEVWEQAVRYSIEAGIKCISAYMLYNFNDKPIDLYYRARLIQELNKKYNARIYGFPMKYSPINALDRKYIGKYWGKTSLRMIRVMTIPTRGVVGVGGDSFGNLWGETKEQFSRFIKMTETEKAKACNFTQNGA